MTEALKVALVSGAFSFAIAIVPKLIDKKSGLANDVKEIKTDLEQLKSDTTINSDMIYQMLDHMATANNTHNMKRCLEEYNAYFRKN